MKEFIEFIAKSLVDKPDEVRVEESEIDGIKLYKLYVEESETGKVIGKSGRTAKAMRLLLAAVAAKYKTRVSLEIPDRKLQMR